jgi:RNA polymerase sigma-70 factor (ECF subfamily)
MNLSTEEGFRMFYEQLQPAVFRLCRFRCADAETARDLSQEAFARAFRARHTLRDASLARAWMLRIALNECRAHHRRRTLSALAAALLPSSVARLAGLASPEPGPEQAAEARDRHGRVRAAIQALPARERDAMLLVGLQQLGYPEAAAALDSSEEAVRQAVSRARRRLRASLAGSGAEPERETLESAGGQP